MVTATTIRVVRSYLNISQGELAVKMGVSKSLVSSVENGIKRITPDFVRRFKQATNITDAVLIDIQYVQKMMNE
jgi:transcriptional regulator with XRE-family HTH domain